MRGIRRMPCALASMALPALARAECEGEGDCKGGRLCRDGRCVDAAGGRARRAARALGVAPPGDGLRAAGWIFSGISAGLGAAVSVTAALADWEDEDARRPAMVMSGWAMMTSLPAILCLAVDVDKARRRVLDAPVYVRSRSASSGSPPAFPRAAPTVQGWIAPPDGGPRAGIGGTSRRMGWA